MASEARAWWADVEHLHRTAEERADERRPAGERAAERWATPPAHARRTVLITGRPGDAANPHLHAAPARPRSIAAVDAGPRVRPNRAVTRIRARPDRIALWAVLLSVFLIVVAAWSADAATKRGGFAYGSSGKTKVARGAYLHSQLGTRTLARGMAGSDVRMLQRLLGVPRTGFFGNETRTAVRRFQASSGLGVDGAVGPATRDRLVKARMHPRMATYYGPGLYGRRTACGMRLTTRLVGVAHRRLPCGSAVTVFYGGRFATLRVVDRGPYTSGVTFDLTSAAARRLGMRTTATVRAAY
jgi:peptidoglycan lytic transglycosylase